MPDISPVGSGPPALSFQGEGITRFATPQSAPAVVLGHEAGNLQTFEAIAASRGGRAVNEHEFVRFGFVNGRLTVTGGVSQATIVTPGQPATPAAAPTPAADADSGGQDSPTKSDVSDRLRNVLAVIEAQLGLSRLSGSDRSTALALLSTKGGDIREALAHLDGNATRGPLPVTSGLLVDASA